jgi:hypothetical protein
MTPALFYFFNSMRHPPGEAQVFPMSRRKVSNDCDDSDSALFAVAVQRMHRTSSSGVASGALHLQSRLLEAHTQEQQDALLQGETPSPKFSGRDLPTYGSRWGERPRRH